jgi:hypothetical protein
MTAIARGLGLLVVLLPGALSALTLTYLDQERGVVSETLAAEASDFVERYDPRPSPAIFFPSGRR